MAEQTHELPQVYMRNAMVAAYDQHVLVIPECGSRAEIGGAGDDERVA